MDPCDVLIVGGGPAGSACAWALKRRGLDVRVMDRRVFPRDKVCAGWITPQVAQALALDLRDYASARVLQPINRFRTGLIGGSALETVYRQTVSYGIRRCEFDDYLLRRSGTRCHLGVPVEGLERDGTGWIVNGEIRASVLVGAGGHTCPVARHLGARLGSQVPVVAAREAEIPLNGSAGAIAGDRPELYFCRDLRGYGWCVRKGGWLNVGLGREDGHDLPGHLKAFCAWLRRDGRIPEIPDQAFKGHAYLLYGHGSRPLTADAALLVGDAAGLAYPRSGEGIRPAVESGLLAAEVIAAADGDYRKVRLEPYAARLRGRFGAERRAARSVPESLSPLVGRVVLGSRFLTRALVLDQWFLHRREAALRG